MVDQKEHSSIYGYCNIYFLIAKSCFYGKDCRMAYLSLSKNKDTTAKAHNFFEAVWVPGVEAFARYVTEAVWSPILWSSGRRVKSGFISCDYIALDYDDGEWTLEYAKNWVTAHNLSAIIGTTRSHGKEKVTPTGVKKPPCDRFRVILRASRTMTTVMDYELNMAWVMESLPCDASCKDAARYFYPCTEVVYTNVGERFDVLPEEEVSRRAEEVQKLRLVHSDNTVRRGELKVMPGWLIHALQYGAKPGESRHILVYRISAELTRLGMSLDEIRESLRESHLRDIGEHEFERSLTNGARAGRGQF